MCEAVLESGAPPNTEELAEYITMLKDALTAFDGERNRHKVLFFDDWAMYRRVREYVPREIYEIANVGELLDLLEPYIPYRLSDTNFDLFMENVADYIREESDSEAGERLAHKAKLDFMLAVRDIKHIDQWERMLDVCESIRCIKDDMRVGQVWVM